MDCVLYGMQSAVHLRGDTGQERRPGASDGEEANSFERGRQVGLPLLQERVAGAGMRSDVQLFVKGMEGRARGKLVFGNYFAA
jgi:hypothetical protein